MTARLPARTAQVRIALALVLLEHKPVDCSLSEYLAFLRAQVLQRPCPSENAAVELDSFSLPCALAPLQPTLSPARSPHLAPQAGPSQPAPAHVPSSSRASPAQLLGIIAALDGVASVQSGGEDVAAHVLVSAWGVLEKVAVETARLDTEDREVQEQGKGATVEGIRTRGRAAKGKQREERVSRDEVVRETFATLLRLVAHALSTVSLTRLSAALAPLASLLPQLASLFPSPTLGTLLPSLLATTHALLSAILASPPLPLALPGGGEPARPVPAQVTTEPEPLAPLLSRLCAVLSLAHLALDGLAVAPPSIIMVAPRRDSDLCALAAAVDALTLVLGAYGVDAHLAALAVPVPCPDEAAAAADDVTSVESAVMALMERLWVVRDPAESADSEVRTRAQCQTG